MRGISELTGPESYLLKLIPALAARGCQSRLICIVDPDRPDPHSFKELTLAGVAFERLNVRKASSFSDMRALPGLIRQFGADIIHTLDHRADLLGRLAGWWTSTPCVSTFMGWSNFDRSNLVQRVYCALDHFSLRAMEHVISDTACNGATLGLSEEDKNLSVIPFGVDTDLFHPDGKNTPNSEFRPKGAEIVFGIIGRLHPQKDQMNFVKAAARIRQKHPKAGFLVIGQAGHGYEAYEASVRQHAKQAGLGDAIQFVPSLPQTKMPTALHAMDVLVAPFLHSGVSFTVFEAMAAGLPIIATENIGSRDIVGDQQCGLLVPGGDTDALSTAMGRMINEPVFRGVLGQYARRRSEQRYSIDAMAERTLKVYRGVKKEPVGVASGSFISPSGSGEGR